MKFLRKGGGKFAKPPEKPAPPVLELAPAPSPAPSPAERAGEMSYAYSQDVVVLSAPTGRAAAALRETALQVIAQHVSRGHRSVAFCGVARGIGVTFLCANVAAALAADGVSTLLIDADLECPSLENFFRPSGASPGLQQYLRSEDMRRDDIVHRDVTPGLSLIYAGGATEHASELVGRSRFRDLVQAAMREHELVIIDTPPSSLTADTRQIVAVAHYAMIVARAGATHVGSVEVLRQALIDDGVEIVGSILNAV